MKPVWKWLIALAVVLVVAVVVDRVAVVVVERQAVAAVEENGDVTGATLDIRGFPFLTQVAGGKLSDVTGSASKATFGGLTVTDVQIDASDVGISSPYPVGSGTASGAVSVASLQDVVRTQTGLDLDVVADGDALKLTGTVVGLELSVDVVPTVADPTTLGIDIESVRVGGAMVSSDVLPSFVQDALSGIKVGLDLPSGITLDSVAVDGDTVRIVVDGHDVSLEELVAS